MLALLCIEHSNDFRMILYLLRINSLKRMKNLKFVKLISLIF